MSRSRFTHTYDDIISQENLLIAWREFVRGKKNRKDVQEFSMNLGEHVLDLHNDLRLKTYQHGSYEAFNINDPKPRNIHKAKVRDRLLHHAVYRVLYPFFDKTFITHSYSCRLGKGTHRATRTFRNFGYKVSYNHTKTAWVLKCDIRKFFASIDHGILMGILKVYIPDESIIWLMSNIIKSFHSIRKDGRKNIGLPLGNLTSQLLVNIYMNEFDQFVKHTLGVRHYIRYADDFVILSRDKVWLENTLLITGNFLKAYLHLNLHPNKITIKTYSSGIDFLGWVHFSDHRVLRTATKRRMFKKLENNRSLETVMSYIGLLGHGNTYMLKDKVLVMKKL